MILDRYIFKSLGIATIFITCTLAAIILLTQSLRFLELVINSGASSITFWILTALTLPRFFEVLLPISLMAAVLFIYNRMSTDSEIAVMRAAGLSPMRLAKPALILSVITTLFLFLMTTTVAPLSLNSMQKMRQVIKAQYSSLLLRDGVFNAFGDDLMVYVREKTRDGELRGLIIHDNRDELKSPVTVIAKKGVIITNENTQQVLVFDGSRQDLDPKTRKLNPLYFKRYSLDLPEDKAIRQRWREPDERTFWELLNPDPANNRDAENRENFLIEAHKRIVSPFLAPCFALIALSFLLLGPVNRRGQFVRISFAIMTVIFLQGLYLAAFNLASKSMLGLILMYAIAFVPIALGFFALSAKAEKLRQLLYSPEKARHAQ